MIFQLISFITLVLGVILILILLKLLQAKQYEMINQLPQNKTIVLNKKNNQKNVFTRIILRYYTCLFISQEIVLSKKFKKCTLDQQILIDCLYFLTIDEIYFIDK